MNFDFDWIKKLVPSSVWGMRRDFWRILPLLLISFALLIPGERYKAFVWVISVVAVMAILSHIMRRIFWPYIDLAAYAKAALEQHNMAAAVVFASVAFFVTMSFTQLMNFFLK